MNLTNIAGKDPSYFAAGGFVGRVYGEVQISGCEVKNLSIGNVKDITGGFAGNVEGMTQYEGLSGLLGGNYHIIGEVIKMCFRLWVWEI